MRFTAGITARSAGNGQEAELLFVFIFSGNRFKILGFKDLAAVQTLHVIDAVTPGNNFGTVMVTHTN
jgi:hypothetical protein